MIIFLFTADICQIKTRCLSSEGGSWTNVCIQLHSNDPVLCSCELDLDLMTLIYTLDPDTVTLYLHTINEVSRLRILKATA